MTSMPEFVALFNGFRGTRLLVAGPNTTIR